MDQNILSSIGAEIFEKDKVMATVKNDLSLEEKKTKTKKESKAKEEVSPPEATDFD